MIFFGPLHAGSGLVVQRRDGTPVQSGALRDIGDAKLFTAHKCGEVAADHCLEE